MSETTIKLKATRNMVLVKLDDESPVTDSGIHLPERFVGKSEVKGNIVSIGAGCNLPLEVGMKVLLPRYQGTEVDYDGIKYKLMPYQSLLAIIS